MDSSFPRCSRDWECDYDASKVREFQERDTYRCEPYRNALGQVAEAPWISKKSPKRGFSVGSLKESHKEHQIQKAQKKAEKLPGSANRSGRDWKPDVTLEVSTARNYYARLRDKATKEPSTEELDRVKVAILFESIDGAAHNYVFSCSKCHPERKPTTPKAIPTEDWNCIQCKKTRMLEEDLAPVPKEIILKRSKLLYRLRRSFASRMKPQRPMVKLGLVKA